MNDALKPKGADKPDNVIKENVIVKEAIINNNTTMKFPKEFSSIVYVRRKKSSGALPREGEFIDESIVKIGSSFKGASVLRGLNLEEEKRWLPAIIGISKESDNWERSTYDYWNNISKTVPPSDKDGNGGLKLEVGLKYNSLEDYEADQRKAKTWGRYGELKDNLFLTIENPKGEPINPADYILWRYCLVYSRVANIPDDIGKSAKIDLYLYSKIAEIKEQKITLEQKRKASQLLYSRLADREWVEHMLRVLIQNDRSPLFTIREISSVTEDEKDIMLEKYMQNNPALFTVYGEDKNLELKSFIELSIATGVLTRIPNTNSISYDGNTIGNSMDEVTTFLNNPKNKEVLDRIKAQTTVKP